MMWAIGAAALLTMTGQVATAPQDQRSEQKRLSDAALYGVMIYAFDKAAWVSTDSLLEVMPRDQLGGLGGYVIEPIDRETLRATYYRGNAASAQAFFVADVRGGKVVRHEILPQPVPLTPTQMILARARDIARDEAAAKGYRPCTAAPFNTVVLPSVDNGPVTVYLLSAQVANTHYMIGGNYRIAIAPSGRIVNTRTFNTSCMNLALPDRSKNERVTGLVVNHLLDPVPTEIHVFASYSVLAPIFVLTPDKRVWQVRGRDITLFKQP
ncbi:hypothetical protein SOM26_13590 [Sphingomonas sp. CFBP8993]|uniref:hypothetical protein n=1 Tax=Sphingomonas sp. CFBP8993 TaxID=3096526 RepID=UPI002A6AA93B|nr:hypothetical protein [Sphingomonas sp. CFBP8993]MDY0959722.1 hypothetical protein [Sphingomonas sp. CFBP8993]